MKQIYNTKGEYVYHHIRSLIISRALMSREDKVTLLARRQNNHRSYRRYISYDWIVFRSLKNRKAIVQSLFDYFTARTVQLNNIQFVSDSKVKIRS